MASADSASYFRRTGILWMTLISLAMGFFTWTVFWPTQVPYEQLGPIGSFAQYMVKNHYGALYNGFFLAWAVHAAEALYTMRLCSTKGITDPGARMQWLIQTFLFGIASLSLSSLHTSQGRRKDNPERESEQGSKANVLPGALHS